MIDQKIFVMGIVACIIVGVVSYDVFSKNEKAKSFKDEKAKSFKDEKAKSFDEDISHFEKSDSFIIHQYYEIFQVPNLQTPKGRSMGIYYLENYYLQNELCIFKNNERKQLFLLDTDQGLIDNYNNMVHIAYTLYGEPQEAKDTWDDNVILNKRRDNTYIRTTFDVGQIDGLDSSRYVAANLSDTSALMYDLHEDSEPTTTFDPDNDEDDEHKSDNENQLRQQTRPEKLSVKMFFKRGIHVPKKSDRGKSKKRSKKQL